MEKLIKYTPAQVALLTYSNKPSFKELLKFTMMDLVVKRVIKLETEGIPESDEKVKYVLRGIDFAKHESRLFEDPMTVIFTQGPELKILFEHFVKMVFENAGSFKTYLFSRIISQPDMTTYFKQGFWQKFLVTVKLTEEGQSLQKQLKAELAELALKLPNLMKSDPEAMKNIIEQIGGNIFLVDGFDLARLKELNFDMPEDYNDVSDYWIYFYLMDDFGDDWDSGSDGYDGGDGDSGDSGDGCSGCSGCGGCGD